MDTKDRNIIYKSLVGSRAYGTNVEGSDYDYKGIYLANEYEVFTGTFPQQISTSKDETYYEVSRFLELLATGNPTMIELLFTPEDCVVKCDPIMKKIFDNKEKFITKRLANSFSGYAYAQIVKAKGLNKKMNWEASQTMRASPRHFCYVSKLQEQETYRLTEYFSPETIDEDLAVTKANHIADCYLLYKKIDCISYYPIDSKDSNTLKCSSVKKEAKPIGLVYFNKSQYTKHCADFKAYKTWIKERNEQRYVDIDNHGQKIDGKNMLHCIRLIDMGLEIAQGKGVVVRRENAEYLKSIRHGKISLQELLDSAEIKLKEVEQAFKDSDLPDHVDSKFLNDLLYEIRKTKA